MSHTIESMTEPPLPQQGATRRRVHPTNPFTPIAIHEVEQSVPQRFEEQVSRYPDRLAVRTREHAWTYAQLNREGNRLAHAILAQCGSGEEPIAILLDQGAPAIAAIFGVLKAGKFFLPLDPTFPSARLTTMLEDSQSSLLITDSAQLVLAEELAQDRCRIRTSRRSRPTSPSRILGSPPLPRPWRICCTPRARPGNPKGWSRIIGTFCIKPNG